jgi:hypothetical protein
MFKPIFLISIAIFALGGCEQVNQKLGLQDPAKKEAQNEAEGKAVGSACRHSGRAIEDCYSIYAWLPKAPIFAGWREMDAYMRESNLETVAPQLPPPEPPNNNKKKKKITPEAGSTEEAPPANAAPEAKQNTEKSAEKSVAK